MYTHTQSGLVILISLGAGAIVPLFVLLTEPEAMLVIVPVLVVLGVALGLFYSLTVTVDTRTVEVKFGIGVISRRIALADIAQVETVRNKWWYGWGIRFLGPGHWMYNVSGLDAVDLELKSGKKFRIGTDDPQGLAGAIRMRLA